MLLPYSDISDDNVVYLRCCEDRFVVSKVCGCVAAVAPSSDATGYDCVVIVCRASLVNTCKFTGCRERHRKRSIICTNEVRLSTYGVCHMNLSCNLSLHNI